MTFTPLPSHVPARVLPWPQQRRVQSIIPVFLPFRGCAVRCIFCAQDVQTGRAGQSHWGSGPAAPSLAHILAKTGEVLRARAARALPPAELAFYGGTFTAMPRNDQRACLAFASEMLAQGLIRAFRCSTRPDCVTGDVLARLRAAGCETVELGVQSFADAALAVSRRGYDGAAAAQACGRVKAAGLRLGVQLLPGMPGVSPAVFLADVTRALGVGADVLRFYPCLVLEGTELARLWRCGGYQPWSLETTLDSLARGWLAAQAAHRPVIRMGLAPEPQLDRAVLAGPLHPALGARIMGRALLAAVREAARGELLARLEAPRACQGHFWGHRGELRPSWAVLGLTPSNVSYADNDELRLWPETALKDPGRGTLHKRSGF